MPTFTVLDVPTEGPAQTRGADGVVPPPDGVIRWVDLECQDEASMSLLRERFDFHPLAIEDCLHIDQRPKIEEYERSLFVVAHGFSLTNASCEELNIYELHCFLTKDLLVTVHVDPLPLLATLRERVQKEPMLLRRGADFGLHMVLDAVADGVFPLMDQISTQLDDIEERVLGKSQKGDLAQIFGIKHTLANLRRAVSPLRDVVGVLAKRGNPYVSERATVYFRDVHDHVIRVAEEIDLCRDLLGNALEAYLSSVANRTNEVMKRLTVFSAIFLPLSFIVGFFGQNFEHLPYKSDPMLIAMLISVVVLPPGLIIWFRSKEWY
jgi:magnesium transporter